MTNPKQQQWDLNRIDRASEWYVDVQGSDSVHRLRVSRELASELVSGPSGFIALPLSEAGCVVLVVAA